MASYPSSGPVHLRTNLGDSALVAALKAGKVDTGNAVFEFCGPNPAYDGFKAMVRENAFDAGELAIVTALMARTYGKPWVLLPATMVGRFQHHTIGYNAERGELKPQDLEGRRVGVRSYPQTTGVWVRGILQHEYGVDLNKVTWVCQEDAHLAEFQEPANVERSDAKKLLQMLRDGDIDAAILGELPNDPWVRPLIPDPHETAKAWYAKGGAVPVNHLFAVSSELSKQRPDVVRDIYKALQQSKAAMAPVSGPDMLPFGLENVRKGVALAIDYALEQKIIPKRLQVEELFDDTTRHL